MPTLFAYRPGVGTTVYPITRERTVIGRASECDIRLPSPFVSREHAAIELRAGQFYLSDCGSKNGTHTGQNVLGAPRALKDREEFFVGEYVLTFVLDDPHGATSTFERGQPALAVDRAGFELRLGGRVLAVSLSPQEFEFLAILAEAAGRVVPHAQIGEALWGSFDPGAGAVPAFSRNMIHRVARRVRIKLAEANVPLFVLTADRVGYRLVTRGPEA
jgi:hypothetical protein